MKMKKGKLEKADQAFSTYWCYHHLQEQSFCQTIGLNLAEKRTHPLLDVLISVINIEFIIFIIAAFTLIMSLVMIRFFLLLSFWTILFSGFLLLIVFSMVSFKLCIITLHLGHVSFSVEQSSVSEIFVFLCVFLFLSSAKTVNILGFLIIYDK